MYPVHAIGVIEVNFHVQAIEFHVLGIHLPPWARDYQIAHQFTFGACPSLPFVAASSTRSSWAARSASSIKYVCNACMRNVHRTCPPPHTQRNHNCSRCHPAWASEAPQFSREGHPRCTGAVTTGCRGWPDTNDTNVKSRCNDASSKHSKTPFFRQTKPMSTVQLRLAKMVHWMGRGVLHDWLSVHHPPVSAWLPVELCPHSVKRRLLWSGHRSASKHYC